jgi:hypothetical protein
VRSGARLKSQILKNNLKLLVEMGNMVQGSAFLIQRKYSKLLAIGLIFLSLCSATVHSDDVRDPFEKTISYKRTVSAREIDYWIDRGVPLYA